MRNLISAADFLKAEAVHRASAAVCRTVDAAPTFANDSGRLISFILSDESVARDGHTIKTAGWDLVDFKKNPTVLFAHDGSQPPVARCVDIGPQGKQLRGTADFAPAETYPFADTVFRLIKGGYLNAVSVSWIPLEWKYTSDKDRPYGVDFLRQTLLEFSIVPVPALPSALVTARAAGIDTRPLRDWATRILDGDGAAPTVPRSALEQLTRDAAEPRSRAGKTISAASAGKIRTAQDHARACVDALEELVTGADPAEPVDPDADEDAEARARRARLFRASLIGTGLRIAQVDDVIAEAAQRGDAAGWDADRRERLARALARKLLHDADMAAAVPDRTRAERIAHAAELRRRHLAGLARVT